MAEVHINRRVFVQPIEVLAFLGMVAFDLPAVPLHPLEANFKHSMWSFASVLSLMHRACQVPERTRHSWTDYTTGEQSAFLLYDMRIDAFAAKPTSPPPSPITTGRGASVGSVRREAQRKRHREGDSDAPTLATRRDAQPTNFQPPETSGVPLQFASGVPAVPPLHLAGQDSLPPFATPQLVLSPEDVAAIPGLARALDNSSHRVWKVGGLLSTLANWYLTRSDEARRINAEREVHATDLRRAQGDLANFRESFRRQSEALERALADRERYRRERDELRAAAQRGVADSRHSGASVLRPVVRDPYGDQEYESFRAGDCGPRGAPSRVWPRHSEVTMPSLEELETEVPRHPGYCPQPSHVSGPTGATDGTSH